MGRPISLPVVAALAFLGGLSDAAPTDARRAVAASSPAERIDLAVYSAIRREGREHAQVMRLASGLMDGIGARLTASPNAARATSWARDELSRMGLGARLEDWGVFGTGWEQVNAWARMTAPDVQPLWMQAAPWSPATAGPVTGQVAWIDPSVSAAELERLKGTLAGKIVLLGAATPFPQIVEPLSHRYTADDLAELGRDVGDAPDHTLRNGKGAALRMLRGEGVAAIIEPSRQSEGGGATGMILDDNFSNFDNEPWIKGASGGYPIPHGVMVPEHYDRMVRLIRSGAPVTAQVDIGTRFTGEGQHGFNVVAEIPGTDPRLAAQVVMAGAHLDSWQGGTGATDDGAGVVVGMEAMRILKAIGARPRRTIRLALWTGEEQGLFGSRGYVRDHLATFAPSVDPKPANLPDWLAPRGPVIPKPDWERFDVYFNLDAGGGRIRGIYTGGDLAAAAVFRTWIEPLADLGVTLVTAREAGGSDQEAFSRAGLPAFAFLQDPLDYETRAHHSNLDTFERLDEEDLQQAAIVEATFLLNAAQRDAMLPRPRSTQRP